MKTEKQAVRDVEQAVLGVYTKVNPSAISIEDPAVYRTWRERREILFVDKLKILPGAFRGARLLEVGGGTGENTVLSSQWGADVTLVDMNPIALERATSLWKIFGCAPTKAIRSSLFDLKTTDLPEGSFDLVFCEGVIHHTADPIAALNMLIRYVKPDGLLMVSFAEASGFKARTLQRALIQAVAGDNEEKIVAAARRYFPEHLRRCVQFGQRTEISVIYDSYVNPQVEGVNLTDVLDVLHANRFMYYSGAPELNFPYATAPYNQPAVDYYNPGLNRKWIQHLQANWMVCGRTSDEKKFVEARPDNVQDHEIFLSLEKKILGGVVADISDRELALIQDGYLGIGLHYLVSRKG
jgi:SAM-dependent methyltransferase